MRKVSSRCNFSAEIRLLRRVISAIEASNEREEPGQGTHDPYAAGPTSRT